MPRLPQVKIFPLKTIVIIDSGFILKRSLWDSSRSWNLWAQLSNWGKIKEEETRNIMSERKTLTTTAGAPVADNQNSQTAGPTGPVLLQDHHLIEKLARFDRERHIRKTQGNMCDEQGPEAELEMESRKPNQKRQVAQHPVNKSK